MDFLYKVLITIFFEEILVFVPLVILFFYSIYSIVEKKLIFSSFLIILLPLIFIFYKYSYLPNFFSSIGQDSLVEVNADFGEAIFYLKTFLSFLFDPEIFKRNRFWLILIASIISSAIIYLILKIYFDKKKMNILILNKYFNFLLILSVIIGLYEILFITKTSFNVGKNYKVFEDQFKKNINDFKTIRNSKLPIKTIVYVGESTTSLNLSLYGYPFNTTPWLNKLKKDKKFIKFNKVYATHTHTTPSLLSAFSLCIKQKKIDCSLNLNDVKNNLSIIDVLTKSNIDTELYSTQGSLGGHNLANKLVFNTKKKIFSSSVVGKKKEKNLERLMGDRYSPELKDREFFSKNFCDSKDLFKKKTELSILHSYAGHGKYNGYLHHVPSDIEFKYPDYINEKNLLGKDHKNFKTFKEYDAAITYIDSSVEKIHNCAALDFTNNPQPIVFIYFSDHGESAATGRGHDSSRLTYEMLHVPLIIYFNESAYKLLSKKFRKLKNLENKNLSLKIIGDIILYLYDLDIYHNDNQNIYEYDKFKSLNSEFILDRKDLDGNILKTPTFWNYKKNNMQSKFLEDKFSKQDTSINLWQLNNFLESKKLSDKLKLKNLICKHRANSFITQYKASLSNGCFETDVLFLNNKTISAHEITSDTNLVLDNFFKSNFQKTTIWLDAKNLDNPENCKLAFEWINSNRNKFLSALVETPTSSIKNISNQNWKNCITKLNNINNVEVAYHLPKNNLKNCNAKNSNIKKNLECDSFYLSTLKFLELMGIKSIAFDFVDYEAIKNFDKFQNYKWHIWHVDSIKSFNKILTNDNIGIMLLSNNKFSNNLN